MHQALVTLPKLSLALKNMDGTFITMIGMVGGK